MSCQFDHKVTVLYQGGSGGFLLYYYLLLSGRYQYSIDRAWHLVRQQFPETLANDRQSWKQHEIWPDNRALFGSADPAVMLICNPLFCADLYPEYRYLTDGSYVILLRAGFRAQLRMAFEKRAYWFTDVSRDYFAAPQSQTKYLRKIISQQQQGYDPMLSKIQDRFAINKIIDLEDIVNSAFLLAWPEVNQHQILWVRRWLDLQSPKTQRLLT